MPFWSYLYLRYAHVKNEEIMRTIGFAEQYYTLWEVTQDIRYGQDSGIITETPITRYAYIQNLSKDRDEAIRKAGTCNIDMDLRGKHYFERSGAPKLITNGIDTVVGFGKYSGKTLAEIAEIDMGYILWMKENTRHFPELIEGLPTYQQHLDALRSIAQEKMDAIERLPVGEVEFDIVMEKSLSAGKNTANYLGDVDGLTLEIAFPDYSIMYYKGFEYALPIDEKGNAKRVKGKRVTIRGIAGEPRVNPANTYVWQEVTVKSFTVNKD